MCSFLNSYLYIFILFGKGTLLCRKSLSAHCRLEVGYSKFWYLFMHLCLKRDHILGRRMEQLVKAAYHRWDISTLRSLGIWNAFFSAPAAISASTIPWPAVAANLGPKCCIVTSELVADPIAERLGTWMTDLSLSDLHTSLAIWDRCAKVNKILFQNSSFRG